MGQSLAIPRVISNDWKRLDLIVNKIKLKLGRDGSPTFTGVTISGLTASTLIGADADKALESVTVGTGLAYARPTLSLSHLGIEDLVDPGGDRILFWDNGVSKSEWLSVGPSLAITATNLDAIQDIRISASPTFAGLHINSAEVTSTTLLTLESDISNNNEYNEILFKIAGGQNYGAIRSCVGVTAGDSYMSFFTTTDSGTLVRQVTIQHNGKVGLGTYNPETLLTMVSAAPYLTLHNVTEEDTDGGGESRLIYKREDGAGTGTACFQFEASHDGSGANDQLGKGIWSVNTGAGLVEGMRLDSSLTATFAGVVQATDFAKTGWPIVTGATFSFDNATKVFTVTDGGSAYYYIGGVKYILGGNKTVDLDDIGIAEGLWHIYFDGATLTASQAVWSFRDEDKALVAILYWDNTNNKEIFLGWEAHTFHMSGSIHARLHYAGGARWEIGLLVSDAGSEHVNVSAGDIWDEDLNIPISDEGGGLFSQVLSPAQLPIYYRDGASAWRKYEIGDKAAVTDVGYLSGGDLKWNDATTTWSNETVGLNNYVAYYVVATNEQTEPIALIMGQRIDNKFTEAKVNNVFAGLSLAGLPFEEMVVLARLILKDTGTYTLEEVLDLRAYNVKGNITSPLISQHAGLGGLNWSSSGHYFDAAVDFNAQNISNIGTVGCGVITQSGATLDATYQPLDDVLTDLAALTAVADNEFIVGTGAGTYAHESGATARTSIGLGTGDSPTFTGLTLTNAAVIGSNSVVFQPGTDSTTFFQVLDADGGTPVLNVDTVNERVEIGATTPGLYMLAPFNITGKATNIDDRHAGIWIRAKTASYIVQINVRGSRLEIGGGVSLDTSPAMSVDYATGAVSIATSIELGHATDTTITRVSAGVIAVEGVTVMMVGGAPTAHVHDGDTLQLDGVNSNGGAFNFTTSGTVTFSEAITMSAGKDLTIAGHVIFNTNNSYIGFTNPRITFNDTSDRLDITGGIIGSATATFEGASVTVGKASTTTGTIILHDSGSANTITLTVPNALAGSLSFTLPPTDGANTEVLQTDGNGVLTWVANAGVGNHAMLDGSVHSDSVADTITRGSLIYGNATPKWDELDISTGFLRGDGTDCAWLSYANSLAAMSGAAGAAFSFNSQALTSVGAIGCGAITGTSTAAFEGASVTVGKVSTTTGTIVLHDSGSANTITLTVPNALAGSLSFTLPPTDGDNTNVLQTNGSGVLTWVAAGGGAAGGGTTTLFAWTLDSITQGTWPTTINTSYIYNFFVSNSSGNDADEIHFSTYLGAGTYTLKVIGTKNTDHGIVDIYIDAAEIASFDFYGTLLRNEVFTQTSISVASAGVKDIKFVIDGKNGSSSGYAIIFESLTFYRTA